VRQAQPGAAIHQNPSPWMYDVVKFVTRRYFNLRGFHMRGSENVPSNSAAIIAANHITGMDPFAVGQGVDGRRAYIMTKKELFQNPLGKWFFTSGNGFPVDRHKPDVGAIKKALRLLQAGELLIIFPQGTRGGQGAREGVGFLASRAKVPVIPTGVSVVKGSYRVVYGSPIPPEGTPEQITDRVMREIDKLVDEGKALG
jgi:1-acyl-sn-glycerol-3-phosphate acyltransferase